MRKLEERIDIQASPDDVWEVLDDFGAVAGWAPYLRNSSLVGERRNGVGTRRRMRHYWGFRLEESVVEWADGHSYAFDVSVLPFPIRSARERWSIDGRGSGFGATDGHDPRVTVTSTVSYDMHLGALGALLDRLFVHHLIRREMRVGLRGLKRFVESRRNG